MKFDSKGRRIPDHHKTFFNTGDDVVVDLGSRHAGISDSSIQTALAMIDPSNTTKFHTLVEQLQSCCSKG